MYGVCSLVALVLLGEVFSVIETTMTAIVIALIVGRLSLFIYEHIKEAREMHHVLYAPIEELIKEDRERENDYPE